MATSRAESQSGGVPAPSHAATTNS